MRLLPVPGQSLDRLPQYVRGQVRDLHARDQHKAVVAEDPLDVRSARAVVPLQEGIARPQPERCRHERRARPAARNRLPADSSADSRGPRPGPSGWCWSSSPAHSRRSASEVARRTRTSPSSASEPVKPVDGTGGSGLDRGRQAGGPGWAGGSGRSSWPASSGSTLRAEAVQYSPLGLRQSSRSHTPRPRAARDSWPSCNASRSQAIVCGRKMRSPTRTTPVLHRTPRQCQVCPVARTLRLVKNELW